MKTKRNVHGAGRWLVLLLLVLSAMALSASEPAWWGVRGVIDTNRPPQDFAAANQGQAKHFAYQAYLEMEESLPGGAGSAISSLVNGFTGQGNYAPVSLGQLKALTQPFYDRLVAVGAATDYPWVGSTQPPADFALANIGQMKMLFSFDPGWDTDEDGMPDAWESFYGLNPDDSADAEEDADDDGLVNVEEFHYQSNPGEFDTDGDGMADGWEVQNGFDPVSGLSGDMAAWYRFDEGFGVAISNAVSGSYTGVLLNASATNWIQGHIGGDNDHALWFDGANDHVAIPTNQSGSVITQGPFTVSAWIFQDAGLNKRWGAVFSDSGWYWPSTNGPQYMSGYSLRVDTNYNSASYFVGCPTNSGACYRTGWKPSFVGRWVHVVGTYAGPTLKLYVDGALAQTSQAVFAPQRNPQLWLGRGHVNGDASFWQGAIDDVRFYRHALSTQEVASLYEPYADADADGLSNLGEYQAGTDPHDPDTDGDGLSDGDEVNLHHTNPLDEDTDGDGLTDENELNGYGTDPLVVDTDDDGADDGYEIAHGLNPVDLLGTNGVNHKWLYHGNMANLGPARETVPSTNLWSARFLENRGGITCDFHVVAPRNLALGSGESAEVGIRLDKDGEVQWLSASVCTTTVIRSSFNFHGIPTMGSSRTLDVYRAEWTIPSFTNASYCPFVRVRDAGSNLVDEVYLLADASAPGVSATNNWLVYPQHLGADPAGGGYPIEWSTRSSGSDVLVIYNSAWTNDANADGVQDSLEVANYYAARRGVPANQLVGVSMGYFNQQRTYGTIAYASFYSDVLIPVRNSIQACTNEIYYLAVCYGIPTMVSSSPTSGQALDAFLVDVFGSVTGATQTSHAFAQSSSDPGNARSLRELRHRDAATYTIFLPSRVDGPDVETAKGLVDKALYAERYMRDGGGASNAPYGGIAMSDDCYNDAGGVRLLWKGEAVGGDVKNLFAGQPMRNHVSPLTSPEFHPATWNVLHDNANAVVGTQKPITVGFVSNIISGELLQLKRSASVFRWDESMSWSGYEGMSITNNFGVSATILEVLTNGMLRVDSTTGLSADQRITLARPVTYPLADVFWHSSYYQYMYYSDIMQWPVGAVSIQHESGTVGHFRSLDHSNYSTRALWRGLTAVAGPVAEPYYNCVPNADLMFSSLVQGFTWAEAAGQAYRSSKGLQRWMNMAVGDPLYAPFRSLWEGTAREDATAPAFAAVACMTNGCAPDQVVIRAELASGSDDEAADVALFKIAYGLDGGLLSNVVDYVAWEDPDCIQFDFSRRYGYSRRLSEPLKGLVAGTYNCQVWAKDPYGNETASSVMQFVVPDRGQMDWDGDGLLDGAEVATYGTDPNQADTDGDGKSDGWEITNGFDPLAGIDESLVAWWRFEPGAVFRQNEMSSRYHLSGLYPQLTSGKFSGTTALYIYDTNWSFGVYEEQRCQTLIDGNVFSVSAWVKLGTNAWATNSFSGGAFTVASDHTLASANHRGFVLGCSRADTNLTFSLSSSGGLVSLSHAFQGQVGAWAHVMATYDGTQAVLYLNGIEVDRDAVQYIPATVGSPLFIGRASSEQPTKAWIGAIDEVRIYTTALSSNTVAEMVAATDEVAVPDTDGDGMPNGWEVQNGLLPFDASDADGDADADGLTNLQEYQYETSPQLADTDGDSYSDGLEVARGSDPLDEESAPPAITIHVDASRPDDSGNAASWATAKRTIQAGVDLAVVAGDTVLVTNGVYETGTRVPPGHLLPNRVVITNDIEVRSVNGPAATVIRGAGPRGTNAVRCVYMTIGRLVGFTVTNSHTRLDGDGSYDQNGGGINMYPSTLAVVSNCVISGNFAYNAAGAAWGKLYNCVIRGNTAERAAGGTAAATLYNCEISGNSGGIYGGGSDQDTMYNCTVSGNTATYGGGVFHGTLYNCIVFSNNSPNGVNVNWVTCRYTCTTPLQAGEGNIADDPKLVSGSHIAVDSPCVGAGSAAYAFGTDLDGEAWLNPPAMGCDQPVDADGDGMPDWWETRHGLDPTSGLSNSLAGWWRLDDGSGTNALNSATNGYHGELRGFAGTTNSGWVTSGMLGGAACFDGVDDWIRIAQSPNMLTGGAFTISAQVKLDSSCASDWTEVVSDLMASTWDGYCLGFDSNDKAYGMMGAGGWVQDTDALADQWAWVALEFDGTTMRLYRNGAQVGTPAPASFIPATNGFFAIGNGQDTGSSEYWKGLIDDVRIYRAAIGTNGLSAMYDVWDDPDGDGLTNFQEYQFDSDPNNSDTDGDGMPDGWENQYFSGPTNAVASVDDDGDGVTNYEEYLWGSDPTDASSIPLQAKFVDCGASEGGDGSHEFPFKRIQEGVDASTPGAPVLIREGIYQGTGNQDIQIANSAVILRGLAGPTNTILDCGHLGRAFHIAADATIEKLTIRQGNTDDRGGALFISGGNVLVRDMYFESCSATNNGGAVYVENGQFLSDHSTYRNNVSQFGSALSATNAAVVLLNNLFYANESFAGVVYAENATASLINNTMAANSSGNQGVIRADGTSEIEVINSIIAHNTSGLWLEADAAKVVRNNCLYGNQQGDYLGGMPNRTGVEGNLSEEPLLGSLPYGNSQIQSDSPCVDAGDNVAAASIPKDLAGRARCINGTVDIGAYESYQALAATVPTIVYVSPTGNDGNNGSDWDHAFLTISAALDAPRVAGTFGLEIRVRAGVYHERITVNVPNIHMYGGYSGVGVERDWIVNPTIIDGSDAGTVVRITAGGVAVNTFDGFVVQNGLCAGLGGGLSIEDSGPIISNCVIRQNEAAFGGGIGLARSAARIENCVIEDNESVGNVVWGPDWPQAGGGGVMAFDSPVVIRNCVIRNNHAGSETRYGQGGGMAFLGILKRVHGMGGAVVNALVEECVVEDNESSGTGSTGGGIEFTGYNWNDLPNFYQVDVRKTTIRNNQAESGGGVNHRLWGSAPTLENCVITDNQAVLHGAAININQRSYYGRLVPMLINHCTISGNSSPDYDSVLANYSVVTVVNSIVWGNDTAVSLQPDSSSNFELVDNCIIEGGYSGPGAGNNITSVDPVLSPDGFHIMENSPAIGHASMRWPVNVDIDGEARPYGSAPDIGADEYIDSDNDGLPDWWEDLYLLDPNDPSDADLDLDEDGFANLEEYEAGTAPNDPHLNLGNCWYVAPDGVDAAGGGDLANPFATISYAFSQAQNGQRVILLPGTYTGPGNNSVLLTTHANSYMLTGLPGHRETTIIDCDNMNLATLVSREFRMSHLTLRNSAGVYSPAGNATDKVTLNSCIFISNSTVLAGQIPDLTVKNCLFMGQTGLAISCSKILAEDCRFIGNPEIDNSSAVHTGGTATSIFIRCSFINCTTTTDGGAIYAAGPLDLENCQFDGNAATASGGAIYAGGKATLENCKFVGNAATVNGGAIAARAAITLESCLLKENHAGYGGAIIMSTVPGPVYTYGLLNNCTVVGNTSGVSIFGSSWSERICLFNCILWANEPSSFPVYEYYVPVTANNCCIQGPSILPGSGNISADPLFEADGWHLSVNSPCRDIGRIQNGMETKTDVDGQPRVLFSGPDIGADEYCVGHFVDIRSTTPEAPYLTWETAATSIQQAIDVASASEYVFVRDGVYSAGSVVTDDGVPCRIALGTGIHVMSMHGAAFTIIMGNGGRGANALRCAYVGNNSVLNGFTLTFGSTYLEGGSLHQDGGGAWCEESGHLKACIVANNAARYGGGVYGGNLEDCQLVNNTATSGGGVFDSFVETSTLSGNTATANGGGAYGGTIRSCLVVNNYAETGGGVYSTTVENGTVCDNRASLFGGGAYGGTLVNSIVYFNTPNNWTEGSYDHCCTTPLPTEIFNISYTPAFLGRENGDYRLPDFSPCVDRGSLHPWMSTAFDLDYTSRIKGIAPDMGAFEYGDTDGYMDHAMALVFDKSSSMEGASIEQAKKETKLTIHGLTSQFLGVYAFDTAAATVHSIARLEGEGDKSAPIRAIANVLGTGGTKISNGIIRAKSDLDEVDDSTVEKQITLWTDADNEGNGADYSLRNIPLTYRMNGVASCLGWSKNYMLWIAQRRRGIYLAQPTSIGLLGLSGLPLLQCQEMDLLPNTMNQHSIVVDGLQPAVMFRLLQNRTGAPTINFEVYRPDGQLVEATDAGVSYVKYEGGCVFTVMVPAPGVWTVKVSGATITERYVFAVQGTGKSNARFALDGAQYSSSAPIPIRVIAPPGTANVTVTAQTAWGSVIQNIVLVDDGQPPDINAGDHLFSAWLSDFTANQNWRLQAIVQGEWGGSGFVRLAEQSIYISNATRLDVPSNCSASQNQPYQIQVTWSATPGISYEIQRSNDPNLWHNAILVGSLVGSSVMDTDVKPGQAYYYRIRAFQKNHTDSEFSPVLTGIALAP